MQALAEHQQAVHRRAPASHDQRRRQWSPRCRRLCCRGHGAGRSTASVMVGPRDAGSGDRGCPDRVGGRSAASLASGLGASAVCSPSAVATGFCSDAAERWAGLLAQRGRRGLLWRGRRCLCGTVGAVFCGVAVAVFCAATGSVFCRAVGAVFCGGWRCFSWCGRRCFVRGWGLWRGLGRAGALGAFHRGLAGAVPPGDGGAARLAVQSVL